MVGAKPIASLSLDLDDEWSYLRTRGDDRWRSFPSYLGTAVPRFLDQLDRRDLHITVFVVGRDAARPEHREVLAEIGRAGHEIGNHSFRHEPWLHRYSEAELDDELARAEDAIGEATGQVPRGFRGPGYSLSIATLEVLVRRGYEYDASTLPSCLGPLVRAFFFRTARLTAEQQREREVLYGTFRDGLRPIKPYRWSVPGGDLVEIPVTTFPGLRVPFHVSYLLALAGRSHRLARWYLGAALRACRVRGVGPSVLLHALDFLGAEEVPSLAAVPGMRLSGREKVHVIGEYLDVLAARYDVRPLSEHAAASRASGLPRVEPRFPRARHGAEVPG